LSEGDEILLSQMEHHSNIVPWQLAAQRRKAVVRFTPVKDDGTLDRGVGHIEGTATPGAEGNSGIAGHRDGFFRGLKDIAAGDVIELDTLHGRESYRVERTWIVDPEDVSVLDPTTTRALTLVTCYPFYFVGSAPRRFIVRAVPAGDTLAAAQPTEAVSCPLCERPRLVALWGFSNVS